LRMNTQFAAHRSKRENHAAMHEINKNDIKEDLRWDTL